MMWIPARGPGRHLGLVRVPDRLAWQAPHFAILNPTDPTHVIAVLVAATHQPAPSGAAIGRVGVGSRMRGNDVLGGWSGSKMAGCALAIPRSSRTARHAPHFAISHPRRPHPRHRRACRGDPPGRRFRGRD